MKTTLSAALLILTFGISSAGQGNCARHLETDGGLSFCPPEGWIELKKAEDKYSQFLGPAQEGFTANLNIKDEINTTPLTDLVAASVKQIILPGSAEKLGVTSVSLVNQSEFITASSQRGFKVTFRVELKGWIIRTVQYYFDAAGDKKFVLTFTSLEAQKAKLDPVCDDSAKTFRLEKQVDLMQATAPEKGSLAADNLNQVLIRNLNIMVSGHSDIL
jgi:hypothetical protein